jgi:hypothetical protein
MKKAKDLIALRLRCLLNEDFSFDQTVNDLYQDLQDSKIFNRYSFFWGLFTGAIVMALLISYTTHK